MPNSLGIKKPLANLPSSPWLVVCFFNCLQCKFFALFTCNNCAIEHFMKGFHIFTYLKTLSCHSPSYPLLDDNCLYAKYLGFVWWWCSSGRDPQPGVAETSCMLQVCAYLWQSWFQAKLLSSWTGSCLKPPKPGAHCPKHSEMFRELCIHPAANRHPFPATTP